MSTQLIRRKNRRGNLGHLRTVVRATRSAMAAMAPKTVIFVASKPVVLLRKKSKAVRDKGSSSSQLSVKIFVPQILKAIHLYKYARHHKGAAKAWQKRYRSALLSYKQAKRLCGESQAKIHAPSVVCLINSCCWPEMESLGSTVLPHERSGISILEEWDWYSRERWGRFSSQGSQYLQPTIIPENCGRNSPFLPNFQPPTPPEGKPRTFIGCQCAGCSRKVFC